MKSLFFAAVALLTVSASPLAAAPHKAMHHAMHPMMVMINDHMSPVYAMVDGKLVPLMVESANGN